MNVKYEAPALVLVGDLESVTKGNVDGGGLDANFPVNTPKAQLRFS